MASNVSQDTLLNAFCAAATGAPTCPQDQALADWQAAPVQPLLLVGSATHVAAQALGRLATRLTDAGEAVTLLHAGLMPPHAEAPRLLWQLFMHLRTQGQLPQMPPPQQTALHSALPNWLARAAAGKPLWLLIADIDALAEMDGTIAWLPDYWPANIRIAASAGRGACARQLESKGWAPCHDATDRHIQPDAPLRGLATADTDDALAAVAAPLALARTPLTLDALSTLSNQPKAAAKQALTHLQPCLLHTEDNTWTVAQPACRDALCRRFCPDEGPQQQWLEALADQALSEQADPLLSVAYYRQARHPQRALDLLLQPETVLATETAEQRMQWLAEWHALQQDAVAAALESTLVTVDTRLLLAAAALVEAAGEAIPAEWLTLAATANNPQRSARARLWQAQAAIRAGAWDGAMHYAQSVLDMAVDADLHTSANHEIARAAEGAGDLSQAIAQYQRALDHQQARHGAQSAALLPALGNLTGALRAAQRLAKARQLAQRAARIARATCGPAHPATATACDQLAAIHYAGADYAAAEAGYRETLAIAEAAFGPQHTATAAALHNLGTTLDARRAFVDAEDCYRRALQIREATYGREHEETAATLHNLAAVLDTTGHTDEAERLYRETTDIWERLYGAEHAATLTSLTNLAGVLGSRGAYADAEVCYRAAIEGWRRLLGDDHPNTLTTLAELGRLYADGGQVEMAEPLLEHVVETSRTVLGVGDNHHIDSVCALAALWRNQDRKQEAEALLNKTLAGAQRQLGLLAAPIQRLRNQLDTLRGDILH